MRTNLCFALITLGLVGLGAVMVGCGGGGGGGTPETVTGSVRYADTDDPAAGVTVQIGDYDPVTTNEQGLFVVESVVAPRTYTVTVTNVPEGYEEYQGQILVELGTGDPPVWHMGTIYIVPSAPPPWSPPP